MSIVRKTVCALAGAALLTVVGLPFVASPAEAGGVTTCPATEGEGDARIRKVGKPYTGNNHYVVIDQEANKRLEPGEKAKFEVRVRNDSLITRNLALEGGVSSGPEFKIRYFRGARNITDKVGGDGKQFADVNPGESTPPVRVTIKLLVDNTIGNATSFAFAGRFSTAPTEDEDECTGDTVLARIPDPSLS